MAERFVVTRVEDGEKLLDLPFNTPEERTQTPICLQEIYAKGYEVDGQHQDYAKDDLKIELVEADGELGVNDLVSPSGLSGSTAAANANQTVTKGRKPRKDIGQSHASKKGTVVIPPRRVRGKAGFTLTCGATIWYPDKTLLDGALSNLSAEDFANAHVIPGKPTKPECQKRFILKEVNNDTG